jgi:predicted ATPase
MIGEKRFLRSIRLRNLLSFGDAELELKSLNVLIGANGSGKSNLIDAVSLLQAAPSNLMKPFRLEGTSEWLWKGGSAPFAELQAQVGESEEMSLWHTFWFSADKSSPVVRESISKPDQSKLYFRRPDGTAFLSIPSGGGLHTQRELNRSELLENQSILSQRKDPDAYPELTLLSNEYAKIKLFREWSLGRDTLTRKAQATDLPADFLEEDASNLNLVLNEFDNLGLKIAVLQRLRDADESITNFTFRVLGGTIQLFVHYEGLQSPVPATRLSDGTIRYLCLLAILCHPEPPPLVCLEEPELGLHPDLVVQLADLLVEASHRTQLIVTTHSDILVDALTKVPEAVVVCEKENGSTRMKRLDRDQLAVWLKEYGLGQLWRSGQIGGNRW